MPEVKFSDLFGLTPKQREAIESTSRVPYTLYGGARGGGKSYLVRVALIRALLRWAAAGHQRVRVGLFCETYPTLLDRQVSKLIEMPRWLGSVHSTGTDGLHFRLADAYGGGTILLRNLDKPDKYKGVELAAICVDELTMNYENVFDILRGSLRWPGIDDCFFIGATNPDGPGRKWVKQYWVQQPRQLPDHLKGHESEFSFVPALPPDNPYLGASYWAMLNTLPKALRDAWLLGSWDVTNEGAVYGEFTDENIVALEPNPDLPVYIFADDGYTNPRAFLFAQKYGEKCLVFAEMYHRQHLAEDCINEALTFLSEAGLQHPEMMVGPSESKELQRRALKAEIRYRAGTHRIQDGILEVRRLVLSASGQRDLLVHPRCKNFLAEIREQYIYPVGSSRSKHELPLDQDNHACDALRYGVHLLFRRN